MKVLLRPDQVDALQAWIDAAKPIMGLSHWHLTAAADPPDGDDSVYAGTFFHDNSDRATVHLGDAYWKESPDDRRTTLAHELVHCVTRQHRRFVQTHLLPRDREYGSEIHEIMVDHLAAIIAPLLPMPDIPE